MVTANVRRHATKCEFNHFSIITRGPILHMIFKTSLLKYQVFSFVSFGGVEKMKGRSRTHRKRLLEAK